jgi:secreted PhoX family phosphatase
MAGYCRQATKTETGRIEMGHHPVEDSNRSDNTSINSVLEQHVSRRLVACGGDSSNRSNGGDTGGEMPAELGFASVPRSLEDRVVLPDGYQASVLIAKGDALFSGITDYQNDGSGEDFDKRSGDEHDGMEFFGLGADGTWDPNASERGVVPVRKLKLTGKFSPTVWRAWKLSSRTVSGVT